MIWLKFAGGLQFSQRDVAGKQLLLGMGNSTIRHGNVTWTAVHSGCAIAQKYRPRAAPSSHHLQQKLYGYLCNFARFHDAFDQLIGALAAVMTLPSHNRFGASITLPKPINRPSSRRNTELVYVSQVPTTAELPHFMALSCTSDLVASCLRSSFWEPGIPCNLASQWLNPAMKEVFPSFIQSKNFHTLVLAMSRRRPNIASLWLGSAITGLLPRVFEVSRTFLPTIFLEAAVWTSSPQSFMDPQSYRLVAVKNIDGVDMISREDEFRLLFVTDEDSQEYGSPPLSPYPPFGLVNVRNSSLGYSTILTGTLAVICLLPNSVRSSANGYLLFTYSWLKKKLSTLAIIGPSLAQPSVEEGFDESVSEIATRNLFSWTFFAEGVRAEEKTHWKHEWLEFLTDRDDNAVLSESSSSDREHGVNDRNFDYVRKWQNEVPVEFE
ncbi:hypothetical protein N7519_006166 [Penicillium mononematosum]|uniref:uncharacterized protein n=1 Tax=Penicillium mononematosum TaxID=268346 RepID=UPI002548B50D|nr:uncharacterized protein N7519_006166 [Penicillium mononematosum]KAJ6184865.1 hypothetical protein N7519_006166 [Penicillium mononematosum]